MLPPEMGGIFVAFQSTPPARGATPEQIRPVQSITISIHAPREGGDLSEAERVDAVLDISIHAPREGGDNGQIHIRLRNHISIHAPPRGGRLLHYTGNVSDTAISIHAPREGGDAHGAHAVSNVHHFNPRPPRGGRRKTVGTSWRKRRFQSTPPARGATNRGRCRCN